MLAADYTGHTPTEPTTTTENASAAWPGGPIPEHTLIAGMPAHGKSCAAALVLRQVADALDEQHTNQTGRAL